MASAKERLTEMGPVVILSGPTTKAVIMPKGKAADPAQTADEAPAPEPVRSATFGQVAVTGNAWLRNRANMFLRGLPGLPGDPAELDDDTAAAVLLQALAELDEEHGIHLRAWDPGAHKRWPKGHPQAGKFRPMIDLIKTAIASFDGKGKPLDNFNREQLLKVARERNITLARGEDKDSIAAKILADLGAPAVPAPAKKAAAKAAKAAPKKAAGKAAPAPTFDDGLDVLDERDLKDLAAEYDLDNTKSRNDLLTALRALGAVSPVIHLKRNQARADLDARLKNIGRRQPADAGPLDRAAADLADGKDAKVVAKQLRTEASITAGKEDSDTLRFLANDLTKKKATIPEYINAKGHIDLVKLGALNGLDIKRWIPSDNPPQAGHAMMDYRDEHIFDSAIRRFVRDFADGAKPRAKLVRNMREWVEAERDQEDQALRGSGVWAWSNRQREKKVFLAKVGDAIKDIEKLADLAEAAKVPAKKRAVTLGGTTLGEIVPVDETRFKSRPLKAVLKHRGQAIPDGFSHSGSGTALVLSRTAPQRAGLNNSENRALDLYTVGVVADGLNGSLRKGRNVHGTVKGPGGEIDLDEVSRNLDSALADSKLTDDTILWRGALPSTADYRRLIPGAIYSDGGYMSTSTEESGARQTINWRQGNGTVPAGRKPTLFKILAPAGTNAALGHERVKEAVLPRGQELRVVRVDESVTPPVVVMEVVPRRTDPGVVRGRSLVDDFDYDGTVNSPRRVGFNYGASGDAWLGAIREAQGFNGKPKVIPRKEMDEVIAGGATELWRSVSSGSTGKTPKELAEQFRSGDNYPGTGVYGSGTYSSPDQKVAVRYGATDQSGLLRIALRRDARVIRYDDLLKLRPRSGITPAAAKLADQRQAELDAVDPTDTKAIKAIIDKYAALAARQGARSQIAGDLGRVAALLGYDAIFVPGDYRGSGSKRDGQTEYVILNRTATYVEEAQ